MSTVSEARAWRGGRQQHSRSSPASTSVSGTSTPVPTGPKNAGGKPTPANLKKTETDTPQRSQPPPNVWNQRKPSAHQGVSNNAGPTDDKANTTSSTSKRSTEAASGSVNDFNSAEVRILLADKSSSFKQYSGSNSSSASTAKMANGQAFFTLLNKQITQLQAAMH